MLFCAWHSLYMHGTTYSCFNVFWGIGAIVKPQINNGQKLQKKWWKKFTNSAFREIVKYCLISGWLWIFHLYHDMFLVRYSTHHTHCISLVGFVQRANHFLSSSHSRSLAAHVANFLFAQDTTTTTKTIYSYCYCCSNEKSACKMYL